VKRFYKEATPAVVDGGHTVLLDGKPIRTPAGKPLAVPTAALAERIAAEWAGQGEELAARDMRLTRLATTATDLMPARRGDAVAEVADYAATDLVCYRAPDPAELSRRQDATWQPWLDWLEEAYGAKLVVTRTVDPIPQPEASLVAVRNAVQALDDWRLVGLHAVVTGLGSLVLGLALAQGELPVGRAFEAALLDELYEIERWGEEREQQRRHARLRADLEAADTFLRTLEG
jgi:chaperone required for assembly of F1-ATPase